MAMQIKTKIIQLILICYLQRTPSALPSPSPDCVKCLNNPFEHLELQLQKEM